MELNITIPPFPGEWKGVKLITDAQREWMERYYPEHSNRELASVAGMTLSYLSDVAMALGVRKTEECMKRIRGRHTVTEANRERMRQMARAYWQEIRDGKRLSPIRLLQAKNPEGYERWKQQVGQRTKSRGETKRFRLRMGLPVSDNIKASLQPYTKTESARRYRALQLGYVLADDYSEQGGYRYTIFYDEDTPRNKRFEENSIKAGFSIRPWDE